ncbi:hypothetical protein V8E55_006896 [Tylopilus felleus]
MFFLTFSMASLFILATSSPLRDMSLETAQLALGDSMSGHPKQCQGYGTLCDWPAGSRGPCCPPLLCTPLSMHKTPYLWQGLMKTPSYRVVAFPMPVSVLIAWLRSYIYGIAVRNDIMSTDKLAHTELLADRSEMGGRRKNRTRLSNPHLNIQVDKHCLLLLTGSRLLDLRANDNQVPVLGHDEWHIVMSPLQAYISEWSLHNKESSVSIRKPPRATET